MRYLILVTALLFSTWSSALEVIGSKADARALIEGVMKDVAAGNMKQGILKLRPYTVTPVAVFDAELSQVELQLPAMEQRFGKAIGYEFVETEEVGSSLLEYIYLQKFEQHALVWRFFFYKPSDKWILSAWSFDDKVELLFD